MEELNTNQTTQTPQNAPAGDPTPKIMAAIAYFIFFVPLLTEFKNNSFVKFHVKQGLILFLTSLILWVLITVLASILGPLALSRLLYPLETIISLGLLALAIIGVYNAWQLKEKPLPLIGSWAKMLKF
jgi:uncharacterized membrane protein